MDNKDIAAVRRQWTFQGVRPADLEDEFVVLEAHRGLAAPRIAIRPGIGSEAKRRRSRSALYLGGGILDGFGRGVALGAVCRADLDPVAARCFQVCIEDLVAD